MPVRKKAVALRYDQARERAPRVVAKGSGEVAEAIVRAAEQADVAVVQHPQVVDALLSLEVEAVIPEELYEAVAEVLAFVYRHRHQAVDRADR
ncbi:MAG: EscU/YscU/HrcU family type III secretion system export apparatus switch protein [Alicyclobacillus shizuokensis]|nr:EscU/YscU/HrcU family type III secretion system export apparatus switch protein [Alicyclobacillus shizuokensis]